MHDITITQIIASWQRFLISFFCRPRKNQLNGFGEKVKNEKMFAKAREQIKRRKNSQQRFHKHEKWWWKCYEQTKVQIGYIPKSTLNFQKKWLTLPELSWIIAIPDVAPFLLSSSWCFPRFGIFFSWPKVESWLGNMAKSQLAFRHISAFRSNHEISATPITPP